MSSSVDQRIVEMRFDNAQFEKGVSTSMSTLDKLKNSLNFDKASKALDDLSASSSKFDLSGIRAAVDQIAGRFNLLGEIAMQVKEKIASMFLEIPSQVASTIYEMTSLGQMGAGFEKYGEKTGAVATLQAQGYALETVNEQLEKLNWFTDETSYNFVDMSKSIGKFTASGRGLEESVDAMMGIATWASLSGQNAQTASSAMYQLAQAMSVGSLKLDNYKSIQNAGMDTAEFRQNALDAAVAIGTLTKNAEGFYETTAKAAKAGEIVTLTGFTESLTDTQWLSSDVMMKVFNQYASAINPLYDYTQEKGVLASEAIEALGGELDQFGVKAFKSAQEARTWGDVVDSVKDAVSTSWMNSFENIFGSYNESKKLWTDLANELYDVFALGGEVRNDILATWKDLGGRDSLIEGFWDLFHGVQGIVEPIKQAFRSVFFFGEITDDTWDDVIAKRGERLAKLTESFKNFAAAIKPTETMVENIKKTFKGLFAAIDILIQPIKAVINGVVDIFKYLLPSKGSIESVLEFTGSIGEMIYQFDQWLKESDVFGKAVGKVVDYIKIGIDWLRERFGEFIEWLPIAWESVKNAFVNIRDILAKYLPGVQSGIATVFGKVRDFFQVEGEKLSESASDIWGKMGEAFHKLVEVLKKIWDKIKPLVTSLVNGIKETVVTIWESIKAAFTGEGSFDSVMDAISTAMDVGIFVIIKRLIDRIQDFFGEDVKGLMESVAGAFESLGGVLEAYQTNLKADSLLKIAEAVGILAVSLIAVALVDSDKLVNASMAIGGLMAALVTAQYAMSKFGNVDSKGGVFGVFSQFSGNSAKFTGLIGLSSAVLILAAACKQLGSIDADAAKRGVAAISILLTEMVVAMKVLTTEFKDSKMFKSNSEHMMKTAITLVAFAFAVKKLAGAVEQIGKMRWQDGVKGTLAVMGLMATLGYTLNQSDVDLSKGAGFTAMAGAIVLMAKAVEMLGTMKTEQMIQGVTAVEMFLLSMGAIGSNLGDAEHMAAMGWAFTEVSAGLLILAGALKVIGGMSMESLAKGLGAITIALGEFFAMAYFMPEDSGAMALAILGMSAALIPMALALKLLGTMDLGELAIALGALAGVFLIFGGAATLFDKATGKMVQLGKAVALVGVGILAMGAGLALAAVGLAGIGASGAVAAAGIFALGVAVIELIPILAKALGDAIIEGLKVLKDGVPLLVETVVDILMALLEGLNETVPAAVEVLLNIVDQALISLAQHSASLTDSLLTIVINVIKGLGERMPEIMNAILELLGGILIGLKDAVEGMSVEKIAELFAGITIIALVFKLLASVANDAKKAAITVGLMLTLVAGISACFLVLADVNGLNALGQATAISEVILAMAGVIRILKDVPIKGALTAIADLDLMVGNMALVLAALGGLYQIPGLDKIIQDGARFLMDIGTGIGGFVGGIIGGFAAGVTEGFPIIANNLSDFSARLQPFLKNMANVDAGSMQGVGYLADAILKLTAAELIDGVANFLSTFTGENGMAKLGQELEDFAPHLKAFYEACSGLDPAVVTIAGYAAGAIAEFANKVPRTGGWLQKITGENDIAKFGEAIASFGPNLKQFADDVTGLDSGSVETAASAASIIAEFATKVPKTDGWVQKITGENDIAAFGESIASFGPNLKQFADDVNGLNADDVTTASTAAEMLVVLANELPNTGGLVQWFEGEASLSEFGEGLVDLGTALKSFGESVKGLNNDDISATTAVANELVVLSTSVSDWLDSSLNLSTFGGQVADFGSYLQTYWGETNNISIPFLSALTAEIQKLVDVANTLSSGSGSALESFGNGLKSIGESGIQNFADSITGSADTLDSAISTMISSVVSSISNKKGEVLTAFGNVMSDASDKVGSYKVNFTTTGTGLAQSLIDGIKLRMLTMSTSFSNSIIAVINNINAKKTSFNNAGSGLMDSLISGIKTKSLTVNSTFTSVVNSIVSTIQSKYSTLSDLGSTCLEKFSSGFSTNGTTLSSSITSAISVAVSAIKSYYNSFYNAGDYLVTGFVNGISENIWRAKAKAVAMAEAALNGARDRLKIQSPSKEFYKIGNFAGLGLVNALNEYEEKAYEAGNGMGAGAMSGLQSAVSKAASIIEEGIDSTPTIRPVMDLSEIQNGTNQLYSMMNDVNGYALSGSIGIAGTTAAGMNQMKAFGEIDPTELALNNLMNAISGMPTGDTYDNKFYITGDNPQEIAEEVSRILRLQVERRNAVWA